MFTQIHYKAVTHVVCKAEELGQAHDNRRTNSLPDITTISKWIEQNALTYEEDGIMSRRPRNLTEKGAAYKLQTLKERRKKVNGRLIRKYITIEDLLFSIPSAVIVEQKLGQFNDLFKMLLSAHKIAMGYCKMKRDYNMVNALMKLMPKHFHSKEE